MAKHDGGLIETLFHQRVGQYWARAARRAVTAKLSVLRRQRERAQRLQQHLDRVLRVSEHRLALPAIGSQALRQPYDAEWAWRPDIWRYAFARRGIATVSTGTPLDDQVTLFHNCSRGDVVLRQRRNTWREDLSAYALQLETFGFDGSFLSVAINLPAEAIDGLGSSHLLRLFAQIELERPAPSFARLNIRHGPNTEQMLQGLPASRSGEEVAFDLAYSGLGEKQVDHAWVDLIFENPAMNQITLRDVTLARCARAAL